VPQSGQATTARVPGDSMIRLGDSLLAAIGGRPLCRLTGRTRRRYGI
jgi:hypothetical protein